MNELTDDAIDPDSLTADMVERATHAYREHDTYLAPEFEGTVGWACGCGESQRYRVDELRDENHCLDEADRHVARECLVAALGGCEVYVERGLAWGGDPGWFVAHPAGGADYVAGLYPNAVVARRLVITTEATAEGSS